MSSEASLGGHTTAPFATARRDGWWIEPLVYLVGLLALLGFATWRAMFQGNWYWYSGTATQGFGGYLSPLFAPVVYVNQSVPGHAPLEHAWLGDWPGWWPTWLPSFIVASPAILILPFPGLFRLTCYYYRKAYYRSFVFSPPACAVAPATTGKKLYRGETFLLLFQNLHRYTLYFALVFFVILSYDAVQGFFRGGQFGVGVGSIVILINTTLLGGYTFGCHSFRHLSGGRSDCFSRDGKAHARFQIWKKVTFLNERHMFFAWTSLFWVSFADFYVWMVASGRIRDLSTWGN